MKKFYDLAIVGGGPAGMMAAIAASESGKRVTIIERNNSLGKKLLLTGKGRCNLTNAKEIPQIIAAFGQRGKFLYPALNSLSNLDLINFFESRGVKTKTERGSRVFPEDDQAESILNCLKEELRKKAVIVIYNFRVIKVSQDAGWFQIYSANKQLISSRQVIITTGGKSYPETGSTGDGYTIAKSFGHQISPLKPALSALLVKDPEIRSLAGLSLKNVRFSIYNQDQKVISFFGEMLFTHQGVSGPIVLNTSKTVFDLKTNDKKIIAVVDLKPVLDQPTLHERIQREIQVFGKKEYQFLLSQLLPKSLVNLAARRTEVDLHQRNGDLNKEEKNRLVDFLKNFSFVIDKVAPLETAIVTSGGVPIEEINPKTMGSKLKPNLFFAGEIIALDGPTGGYNLQKAFSTGWLAGKSVIGL